MKGRFILEVIITLWGGFDYAKETNQDSDFEKAYEELEWDFIFQALEDSKIEYTRHHSLE